MDRREWKGVLAAALALLFAIAAVPNAARADTFVDNIEDHPDHWVTLVDGSKGYAKQGKLVTGWLDVGSSKYWFDAQGHMATGWTDVEQGGKTMHYYFNPASGNLAHGTWMTINGRKYYFRPSGNMATGFADIDDNGTKKKYCFDASGQLLTGWQDVEVNSKQMRYYFRPAGSMATGWATIDGEKYFFRDSGNMATGWTTMADDTKRYFDDDGTMHVGWLELGASTYYFRPSGAMQTGVATIDGQQYTFSAKGVLATLDRHDSSVQTSPLIVISLSEQHVRLYEDGLDSQVVWESDCVTGNPIYSGGTQPGVFAITEKASPQTLVGRDYDRDGNPDYIVNVMYWMHFNDGEGLHDATWRDVFGGDVFVRDGSHGCVNLPLEKARELYAIVELGDTVLVRW